MDSEQILEILSRLLEVLSPVANQTFLILVRKEIVAGFFWLGASVIMTLTWIYVIRLSYLENTEFFLDTGRKWINERKESDHRINAFCSTVLYLIVLIPMLYIGIMRVLNPQWYAIIQLIDFVK